MAEAPIRFGVNYLPNAARDTLSWAQVAEEVGFDLVGIADSQSLYRDVYMCLALCAAGTSRVRLGPQMISRPMPADTQPRMVDCLTRCFAPG